MQHWKEMLLKKPIKNTYISISTGNIRKPYEWLPPKVRIKDFNDVAFPFEV